MENPPKPKKPEAPKQERSPRGDAIEHLKAAVAAKKTETGATNAASPEAVPKHDDVAESFAEALNDFQDNDGAAFSRPQLMAQMKKKLERNGTSETPAREDALRAFGQLLRSGQIKKVVGGRFVIGDNFVPQETVGSSEPVSIEAPEKETSQRTTGNNNENIEQRDGNSIATKLEKIRKVVRDAEQDISARPLKLSPEMRLDDVVEDDKAQLNVPAFMRSSEPARANAPHESNTESQGPGVYKTSDSQRIDLDDTIYSLKSKKPVYGAARKSVLDKQAQNIESFNTEQMSRLENKTDTNENVDAQNKERIQEELTEQKQAGFFKALREKISVENTKNIVKQTPAFLAAGVTGFGKEMLKRASGKNIAEAWKSKKELQSDVRADISTTERIIAIRQALLVETKGEDGHITAEATQLYREKLREVQEMKKNGQISPDQFDRVQKALRENRKKKSQIRNNISKTMAPWQKEANAKLFKSLADTGVLYGTTLGAITGAGFVVGAGLASKTGFDMASRQASLEKAGKNSELLNVVAGGILNTTGLALGLKEGDRNKARADIASYVIGLVVAESAIGGDAQIDIQSLEEKISVIGTNAANSGSLDGEEIIEAIKDSVSGDTKEAAIVDTVTANESAQSSVAQSEQANPIIDSNYEQDPRDQSIERFSGFLDENQEQAVEKLQPTVSELVNYTVQKGDNLWNLWDTHAAEDMSNAQKAAMEAMVRADPEMFGIDSSNPDLIYAGEVVNMQAMFDQATQNGIISPDQNPHWNIADTEIPAESTVIVKQEDMVPVKEAGVEVAAEEIVAPAEKLETTVDDLTVASNSELTLVGNTTEMAEQLESYFQDNTTNLPIEDVKEFLVSQIGESNYELLRNNITNLSGARELFVESVAVASNDNNFSSVGDRLMVFTDTSDVNSDTRFVYNLDKGVFDLDLSQQEPVKLSLVDRLKKAFT